MRAIPRGNASRQRNLGVFRMPEKNLLQLSESAQTALAELDLSSRAEKGAVRVYFQGFG